jgi:hypothetical protein
MGWVYNTSKKALTELVAQELVTVADPGPPARYRLLDRSVLGDACGLVDPDTITTSGPRRRRRPCSRPQPKAVRTNRGASAPKSKARAEPSGKAKPATKPKHPESAAKPARGRKRG